MVMKGSFSMDGTTPASHIGPLYPALLALLYRVVGHRPAWVPLSQHGIGRDCAQAVVVLSLDRYRNPLIAFLGNRWLRAQVP